MNSSIVAKIPFYFKGEYHVPAVEINLSDWAKRETNERPDFLKLIVQANGINHYGYELEVMEVSDVLFETPNGLAVEFYDSENESFDFDGFRTAWQQQGLLQAFNEISQRILQQPIELDSPTYQALKAAYELGLLAKKS